MQKRWPGSTGRKNAVVRSGTNTHGSSGELALDEPRQASQRLECRRADFVVGHGDAEMLLQRGDEIDDGDRIELGHGPEERRSLVHALDALPELQRAAHE